MDFMLRSSRLRTTLSRLFASKPSSRLNIYDVHWCHCREGLGGWGYRQTTVRSLARTFPLSLLEWFSLWLMELNQSFSLKKWSRVRSILRVLLERLWSELIVSSKSIISEFLVDRGLDAVKVSSNRDRTWNSLISLPLHWVQVERKEVVLDVLC